MSSTAVTEWQLQQEVTERWMHTGLDLGTERLYLAAWEVMSDWRINDARRHWNLPSIDFLFVDAEGRLVVMELKRRVRSAGEAWRVLCQVTHRACGLGRSYNLDLLDAAHEACWSGRHGRGSRGTSPAHIGDQHAAYFDCSTLSDFPGLPVRRLVAAQGFSTPWHEVLSRFATRTKQEIVTELDRYKLQSPTNREMRRFVHDVSDEDLKGLDRSVHYVVV